MTAAICSVYRIRKHEATYPTLGAISFASKYTLSLGPNLSIQELEDVLRLDRSLFENTLPHDRGSKAGTVLHRENVNSGVMQGS